MFLNRQSSNNFYPLLDEYGHLTNSNIGKAEMFNAFLASTLMMGFGGPRALSMKEP